MSAHAVTATSYNFKDLAALRAIAIGGLAVGGFWKLETRNWKLRNWSAMQ